MQLTADVIYGFSESMLKSRYDEPKPTPNLHRELWELCCDDHPYVSIAAPRGHAKSTACTHAFTLACVLFREKSHVCIISDTEGQASDFLNDIRLELQENALLIEAFQIQKFIKESTTEIIVQFTDGEQFRIIAKGAGQKVRGKKWRNKRLDLIIGDDLENEDMVENKEIREKFRKWFKAAVKPSLSKTGCIRIVGTILHMDSLLENLINNSEWLSARYAAHNEDFSEILWPEQFSKEDLISLRQDYVNDGFPEVYAQEYLNNPIDENTALFRKDDLLPITDHTEPLKLYCAGDLAVSKKEKADYTVFLIVGMNPAGVLKVIDCRRGRWDSLEIVEEIFSIQGAYDPEYIALEKGVIEKSIGPFLNQEMLKRGIFPCMYELPYPGEDKIKRSKSIQGRVRARGVEFDKTATWWPDMESELLRFPKDVHDDIVDAFAWVGLMMNDITQAYTHEEQADEDWETEMSESMSFYNGSNSMTGY